MSWRTTSKWAQRCVEGVDAMDDREPQYGGPSTRGLRSPVVRKIVHLRWTPRLGPVQIGARLGVPASTVQAAFSAGQTSYRGSTASPVNQRTPTNGPGRVDLVPVGVTKLGNFPRVAVRRRAARRPQPHGDRQPHRDQRQGSTGPRSGLASCSPSATTSPGSLTASAVTTEPQSPRPAASPGPFAGSPNEA